MRTAHPKPGMLDRMYEWSSDLKKKPGMKFMVLLDETTKRVSVQEFKLKLPKNEVLRYTKNDIVEKFPVWKTIAPIQGRGMMNKVHINNRYFHMESIHLAVDFVEQNEKVCDNAQFWVFEDDVFLCGGSILDIIQYYDQGPYSDADLLDTGVFAGSNPFSGWASSEYKKRYPHAERVMHAEYVARFSKRLLTHMNNLGKENVTAESEWFAPTVAKVDGFKSEAFSKEHLGKWSWSRPLRNKERAEAICEKNGQDGKKITLNHSGKY